MSSCFENHFLYHYYEAKIGAFFSLSDLPLDEAEKILDHIRAEGVVKKQGVYEYKKAIGRTSKEDVY